MASYVQKSRDYCNIGIKFGAFGIISGLLSSLLQYYLNSSIGRGRSCEVVRLQCDGSRAVEGARLVSLLTYLDLSL